MEPNMIRSFNLLTSMCAIGSGFSLAYAVILYSQDPFAVGNEGIKEQLHDALLMCGGLFLLSLLAFLLMRLLAKSKGYL
ncbi:hypothetical protein [uncultured Psychrobacter sp.]|uniref:hypothetical protein n=1 Tax=uncultured Psychrobacter sp. TaxID=259303 RepID=UPI0030DA61C2